MSEKKKHKKSAAKKQTKAKTWKSGKAARPKPIEKSDVFVPQLNTKVSPDQWTRLVELANEFQELKPWEWMYDADFFGVKTPAHPEICYGSILGAAGMLFGLTAYIGQEGLFAFLDTADGYIHPLDFRYMQKCLMGTYETKKDLADVDLDIFKHAGLPLKGAKLQPIFRSYEPGILEWYLDEPWQAQLMIDMFEAALYIAPIAKVEPARLAPEDEKFVLLLTAEDTDQGRVWRESFFTLDEPHMDKCAPLPCDEIRLQRLKSATEKSETSWEADLFFSPTPIFESEEQRPFYPRMAMLIDTEDGMLLHFGMDEDNKGPAFFQEVFLQTLEKAKIRPKTVYVSRVETEAAIKNAAEMLGVTVELVEELHLIVQLREELQDSLLDMDTDEFDELD